MLKKDTFSGRAFPPPIAARPLKSWRPTAWTSSENRRI